MKYLVVICWVIVGSINATAQEQAVKNEKGFAFGVSPGVGFSGAYFGFRGSRVMPYLGMQHISANVNASYSGREFDYDLNRIVNFSHEDELKGSATIIEIGARLMMKQSGPKRSYWNFSLAKPFIEASLTEDGVEDRDLKEDLKNFKSFGAGVGYGVEYFFHPQFTIGGEFGLRILHMSYEDTYDDEIYDPNTGNYVTAPREYSIKGSLRPTYSRISINFYF